MGSFPRSPNNADIESNKDRVRERERERDRFAEEMARSVKGEKKDRFRERAARVEINKTNHIFKSHRTVHILD